MPRDRDGDRTEIPSTIKRSDKHAQEIWKDTHDSAVESYGEGERAHRTAFASLKHSYKKEGDRWVPKDKKGPSDPRQCAAQTPARSRATLIRRRPPGARRCPCQSGARKTFMSAPGSLMSGAGRG